MTVADPLPSRSRHSWRAWAALVPHAIKAWLDDFAPSMGAALSYYTIVSIAPLLVIVIAIASLFFGREAAHAQIFHEISAMMGTSTAESLAAILAHADDPRRGGWSAAAGIVVMLVGATTVLAELQSSLDRIWRSPAAASISGWWDFLRTRLLSFSMILGLVFLLLVSLTVSASIAALGKWGGARIEYWGAILETLNLTLGFGVTALLFAMIYKLLPREQISWSDVWVGSVVTAALFTLGKILIGLYIGKAGVADAYGAAGSLVVLLIWVYYSAQIFLLGAEFTWVYAYALGSRADQAPPEGRAVPVAPAKKAR